MPRLISVLLDRLQNDVVPLRGRCYLLSLALDLLRSTAATGWHPMSRSERFRECLYKGSESVIKESREGHPANNSLTRHLHAGRVTLST